MEITDEQKKRWTNNKASWDKEAKEVQTPDDLKEFCEKLINHCQELDMPDFYEETANSTGSMAYAVCKMCAAQYGLSNWQMGSIMWDIIDKLILTEHECGLEIKNYSDMLYPQYEHRFAKTISKDTWQLLQQKAKEKIESNKTTKFPANEEAVNHWQSIVNGKVPFGYAVVANKF